MVADHETSDRDCDGWDAPHVFNDLTGATSAASTGVFGVWFRVNGLDDKGSEDWFDDGTDAEVETSPTDPIINGPFGSGAGGLGLFGSTSMDLNPADNPSVAAHVWRTGHTLFLSKGAGGATLVWANASGATGYRVYRGTTADFMTGAPGAWGTPSTNGTADAETPVSIFFYIVHATDGSGESAE
jgi:hypothetical protein